MQKQASVFASLEALLGQRGMYKSASSEPATSMPKDPKGDGTVEPETGSLYSDMTREVKANPSVVANATEIDVSSVSATAGNMGTELYEVDDLIQSEYNQKNKDPGTSMPAKISQYKQASLAENKLMVTKLGSILLQGLASDNQAGQKTAMYGGLTREQKLNMIIVKAAADGERLAANLVKQQYKQATGAPISDVPVENMEELAQEIPAEAIPAENVPDDVLAVMRELQSNPEALEAVAEILADNPTISAALEEQAAANPEVAEIAAIAGSDPKTAMWYIHKQATEISPDNAEVAAALESLPPEELAVLADELATEDTEGGNDPELDALTETLVDELEEAEATTGNDPELDALVDILVDELELEEAEATTGTDPELDTLAETLVDELELEEAEAAESEEVKTAVYHCHKLASDIAEGDAALAAELAKLPPEVIEELAEELAMEDAAGATDSPAVSEAVEEVEAAEALSSVLEEEQITPEDLEAITAATEKQSVAREVADTVRQYRRSRPNMTLASTPKQAMLRKQCRAFLTELIR